MVEKLINCGANFNEHEIYKLAFDYRHDDIFVSLIDKKIESDKFYGKLKNEFGKIDVDKLTNLGTNFISKHSNDTIDNPYLELIELVDPKYHEKNSSEFFGHLINLAGELEVERDNFFEMFKELFIKKINRNGKFYCCIKEMYLMILMKKIICDLLREKCYKDPKIKHFIGSQNIDL